MAIAYTRDRVGFVRALVRFKEHSMGGMALAFPGNRRQLLHRVLRISRQENKTLSGRERLVLLGGCLMVLCLLVARADMKIKVAPVAETRLANAQVVSGVSKETFAVLQQREQVTQNMEWVKAQLDQLHHKPAVKKKTSEMDQEAMNAEQASQAIAEQAKQEAAEQIQEQKVAKEEEEVNRAQAELEKLEADKDRKQAELDRQQAERDRHQADLDRLQAEQDRLQAERDRKQAELDRKQADKERDTGKREQQTEQDRKQAERDRQQARRDRTKIKK